MSDEEQRAEYVTRQIVDGTPAGRWYLEGYTLGIQHGLTQGRSEGYARGIRLLEDMKAAGVALRDLLRDQGETWETHTAPAAPPRPVPTVDQCLASWDDSQVSAA